ncbi:MAG: ATP-binding protein [Lachnospiraceae bacterium]|nr:ATP-binding protein [Lachnospiraceae bacterium]
MEKMILSLKNIYMTLMTEDFPIYSESVIGRNERKGQTMLRFWQGQVVSEFRSLPCGKMIWKSDGKRNRYTSYLCNRSAEIKTYSEYAEELASQVGVWALLNQIDRFSDFLSGKKYRHDVLVRRILELIRLTEMDDPQVSAEIADHIRRSISWQTSGMQEKLFQASYLLTVLMLYAAAGEVMDDPVMAVLRSKECSIEFLWNAHTHKAQSEPDNVTFLTVHCGFLQDNPLPQYRFFGREKELFDLKEMASSNRKCLITGIGGIGKTELLRQLIRRCTEEKLFNKVAVVPYETDIVVSFARCFPGNRQNPEDNFQFILQKLRKESEQGKLLILIDNLTNGIEEDTDLNQLLSLDCSIFITTRCITLNGFEIYNLNDPTASTGELIFRDNYGHPLSREDQLVLAQMLGDTALCHPLTIRLMARAAYSNGWSVEALRKRLEKNDKSLSWQEEARIVRLSQVYRQLYSYMQIPDECRKIAEIFTLLPRDSYSQFFLEKWFPDIIGDAPIRKLDMLTEGGWLDADGSGWSMHPLIAQCLQRTVLNERIAEPFLRIMQRKLLSMGPMDAPVSDEADFCHMSRIYAYIISLLGGSISPELLWAFANSVSVSEHAGQTIAQYERLLKGLKKRCVHLDDTTETVYWRTLCRWRHGDTEQVKQLYQRQNQQRTVSETLYCDFCLSAGYFLKYRQETALAEEMFLGVLAVSAEPVQIATAYFYMYELTQVTGDYSASSEWGRKGADYVKKHPECGEALVFSNLFALGAGNLKFGKELALEALRAMKDMLTKASPDWCRAQYAALAGTYELLYGTPEAALEHYLWQKKHILEYQGKCYSYYNMLGQVGQVQRQLKRYEEALETYREILSFAGEHSQTALHQRISCNISGVYLDMKKPEEALIYLHDAVEEGRVLGGLPLGEALRYTAEAYEQLGDTAKEFVCLQEANPLLDGAYGLEHPRSMAVRKRLAQLTQKFENK